ncbi:MAG: hypothetical protein HS116_25035 [Planctomycetes bacterium]|nr:hypothetical protein [Planctomycetota bacterium]
MSNGKSPSLTWGGVLLAISVVTGQFVNLAVEYLTADRVTLPATAEGALSGSNEAVLRYDGDTDQIVASVNGGAYGPLAGGGIEGSGSNNAIVKWTGEDTVGESIISDDGTGVTVNGTGLAVSNGGIGQAFAIYVNETETQLAATGDLKLSAPAGEVLIDSVDLTIDTGDLNVSAGDINAVGGNLDLDADLRLGYLASGQGYLASTHGFNAEYRFLEFGASEPADFTNVSNTAGKDVYFKAQSGGAHTAGNPAGGSFIFEPGARGSGGAGANGTLGVMQPGGTRGTDEVVMFHDGSNGYLQSNDGSLLLRLGSSAIISLGSSSITAYKAFLPDGSNTRDIGNSSAEWRALYLAHGSNSGTYYGIGQEARIWYSESGNGSLRLTTKFDSAKDGLIFEGLINEVSGTTDGYITSIRLAPSYGSNTASNLSRHNYIDLQNPLISGDATISDACALRFNANLGTHKATTNSDKTGNTKSGTIKVNINGTIYHIQLYAD